MIIILDDVKANSPFEAVRNLMFTECGMQHSNVTLEGNRKEFQEKEQVRILVGSILDYCCCLLSLFDAVVAHLHLSSHQNIKRIDLLLFALFSLLKFSFSFYIVSMRSLSISSALFFSRFHQISIHSFCVQEIYFAFAQFNSGCFLFISFQ